MKLFYHNIIIIGILSFNILLSSKIENNWNIIQNDKVIIKFIEIGYPKCQAEILINSSLSNILEVVEDIGNYKLFFDSLIISDLTSKNEVRLAIDMPFPFTDRDYTVKFSKIDSSNTVKYLYEPVNSDFFPLNDDFVRLINARGGWSLTVLDLEKTLVTYTWNGDMRGKFPKRAYPKAWIKQGNEIMLNLEEEVKKRNIHR